MSVSTAHNADPCCVPPHGSELRPASALLHKSDKTGFTLPLPLSMVPPQHCSVAGTSQSGTGQAFCTCDSGVAPTACAVATDTLFNGRCYKACLANYTASGASCVQTCPTGYTDSAGKCTLVDVVVSASVAAKAT